MPQKRLLAQIELARLNEARARSKTKLTSSLTRDHQKSLQIEGGDRSIERLPVSRKPDTYSKELLIYIYQITIPPKFLSSKASLLAADYEND